MKKLLFAILLALSNVAWNTPPSNFKIIEFTRHSDNIGSYDSIVRGVENDEKAISLISLRGLPVLHYINDDIRVLMDSIITTEKIENGYNSDIQFVFGYGKVVHPSYVRIAVNALEFAYPYQMLLRYNNYGVVKHASHSVIVVGNDESVFKKIFVNEGSILDVEMLNYRYKDRLTDKIMMVFPTYLDGGSARGGWKIRLNEDCKSVIRVIH